MGEIVDELRTDGPRRDEVDRARSYAAGRRVLAFENTNAVARYAATQRIVFAEDIDPDAAIAALDAVTYDQVAGGRGRASPRPARSRAWGPPDRRVRLSLRPARRGAMILPRD
jgi:hypothetical protein